jgi:3-deoxy-D-manno-octulosonate 8-phosphate phosphatase (KDO 8-P phosphatase)
LPDDDDAARLSSLMDAELAARARRVRFLSCDVDGVLTDGRIYVDDRGREFKAYSALDGVAINLLARAGIVVAWITGSAAPSVTHRAQQLRVPHVVLDAHDKMTPWQRLRGELGLTAEQCAHIGDDLPDIPLLEACGLAATVPHAPAAVRARAHYVTAREGGMGAVRELADLILAAQGHGGDAEVRDAQLRPPFELAREER